MRRPFLIGVLAVLGLWLVPSAAPAQSRCADCHFANIQPTFASHLSDWDGSAHSRNRVGCEACHGGNPNTFEAAIAHRGILPPASPTSPVHRSKIPVTCGGCHAGQFVAFQQSRHNQLLASGNAQVPTCITCHDEVGSRLLSAKALEGQCAGCHGAGKSAARPDFPRRGRVFFEGVRDARALLKQARGLIAKVKDPARRTRLERDAQQAQVPLTLAIQAAHTFKYDDVDGSMARATERATRIIDELANPSRP